MLKRQWVLTTHSVEDIAEQPQYPVSTVKERVAQWQDKMVRWQGGVEREATDIVTRLVMEKMLLA